MPWIAVLCLCLVGACSFDADYSGGTYSCSAPAMECPSGLECREGMCVGPRMDAAIDTPVDGDAADASLPELSCAIPGVLTSGQTVSGTTVGRQNMMTSTCANMVQNARDAVYAITTAAPNQQLTVTITGTLNAYVLNACEPSIACLTGKVASSGSSLLVTAAMATTYFVVVDHYNPTAEDSYQLKVTAQ